MSVANYITDIKYRGKWYKVLACTHRQMTQWLIGESLEGLDNRGAAHFTKVCWINSRDIEEAVCAS